MKLYGGKRPDRSDNDRGKITAKKKIVISAVLIVAALITTVAAVAMNHVKPPETTENQDERIIPQSTFSNMPEDGGTEVTQSARREDFFTMLVVGTDAASGSTDTILLASFDTAANKMNIMSIPRDTIVNVRRSNKKINTAYACAGGDVTALYDEVESVTGVRPDKYVFITVDGFVELIDAIGGVTVDVPINMYYKDPTQDLVIDIDKGLQTLDGYDAMGFMRYRKTYAEGDIGRIKMQHTFINATVKKLLTPSMFMKIPELARILEQNVETDLSVGNMVWLGKRLVTMDTSANINMHTLPGYAEYYEGLSYYFPSRAEVLEMVNEFYNPYTTPIQKLDLFTK